ncbi:hypothetical protein SAMN04488581_3765 [Mycolicibacterium neoaurum]|uniref:hypothetical protein n=1 Tax=Mycolicibacterium neoaurum TaxID=1795 RepID=UPI0005649803|nr:hypothetical protein [Mycolicibacterium neoaurum]SDE28326.1 hypothetical protein SAMN04488581_3765 [Mycolicibacterium neoaurum]
MSIRDQYPGAFEGLEVDSDFFDDEEDLPSSFIRAALVDGLQNFDMGAAVSPFVDVTLTGEVFRGGDFNAEAADIVLRLQNEIHAVSPGVAPEDLKLGIKEFSSGSLVLHVRPSSARIADGTFRVPSPGPLEGALHRVVDLHDSLETDPEALVRQTEGQTEIHDRVRQLVESLDKADAELSLDIYQSDGKRRRSVVSARGRENARRLFERKPVESPEVIAGVVDRLDGAGKVRLRVKKFRPEIEEVPESVLTGLRIGQFLRILVSYQRSVDSFQERTDEKWRFTEVVQHDDVLPNDEDE